MGIIFASRDVELDREVAVKLLLKEHQNQPRLRQQFANEARITGRLQHPGIVPIYQTGTSHDDRPYFAMKLVKGQTLAELLTTRSSPEESLPKLLNIFVQVCQTLSYAHACGVIHHDIKPANIMVGAFGEVHLMDWGLARVSTDLCAPIHRPRDVDSLVAEYAQQQVLPNKSSRDRAVDLPAGAVWGTPAYMSPEQSRGQIADLRTDVFGLGGILCEILTGSPPYAGKSFLDVCLKATRADLEQAYSGLIDSGATGVLVRLAMNCLSPDPDDREQTIAVMSQLRRGQPVVQFQNRYSVADGTWRWFEWTAKSVPADNIIFAVARDVTNRMR